MWRRILRVRTTGGWRSFRREDVDPLWAEHGTAAEDDCYDDPSSILRSGPLHGLQIAVPRWSPDGKQIAFIGGLMSDQGSTGGDLYVIPAKAHCSLGGEPKDLTPDRAASVAFITVGERSADSGLRSMWAEAATLRR